MWKKIKIKKKGLYLPEPLHSEGGGTLSIIKYKQGTSIRSQEKKEMVTRSHGGPMGGVRWVVSLHFCQLGENSNSQRPSLSSKQGGLFKAIRLVTWLRKQACNQGLWRICLLPSTATISIMIPLIDFL